MLTQIRIVNRWIVFQIADAWRIPARRLDRFFHVESLPAFRLAAILENGSQRKAWPLTGTSRRVAIVDHVVGIVTFEGPAATGLLHL